MEKLRKAVYLFLCLITVLVMLASVLSVFRNTPSRYLKILDFPRLQFFVVSGITLILFVLMTKRWRWYDYALVVGLVGGLVVNGRYLANYSPLVSPAVAQAGPDVRDTDRMSLLLANVKMKNRRSETFLEQIRNEDPDLLLVMETDNWWDEQLRPIEANYPYGREQINGVAYGMALYSKFPLRQVEVNDLNNEKVPSFRAEVEHANGRRFVLHAVHPVPPMHFEEYPDNEGQEEVAMRKVGAMVDGAALPSLVAGDLNDVVWGFTDELFAVDNELHDVRVGRGLYNSFNARKWYMRWPIDHVFATEQFQLARIDRLGYIGSDHFPIYVELVLPVND